MQYEIMLVFQVEMDHPDKHDTVTELYTRGWQINATTMDIFKQCWSTMDKLHTIKLVLMAQAYSRAARTYYSVLPSLHMILVMYNCTS